MSEHGFWSAKKAHKHRHVRVKYNSRVYRLLKKPLRHSTDRDYVERSRLTFGPCGHEEHRAYDGCYVLTVLGLLHSLTGLTIQIGSTWSQTKKAAGE